MYGPPDMTTNLDGSLDLIQSENERRNSKILVYGNTNSNYIEKITIDDYLSNNWI